MTRKSFSLINDTTCSNKTSKECNRRTTTAATARATPTTNGTDVEAQRVHLTSGPSGAPGAAAAAAATAPLTNSTIIIDLSNNQQARLAASDCRALASSTGTTPPPAPWSSLARRPDANQMATAADQQKQQQQQQQPQQQPQQPPQPQAQQQYTLSSMRWTTLMGICVFGICNGFANENNSVLQVYVEIMDISLTNYVYLSQLFFFVPFVVSFLAAGLVDKFGARLTIFAAILFATIRNSARALLFSPQVALWADLRYLYWALQRVFTQFTVAIYFCLQMRLAESWFAESERSLALSLLLVSPILGRACASLIFPHYIIDLDSARPMAHFNLATALVSILFVTLTVRRSKPGEGAPSARSQVNLNKLSEQAASGGESLRTKIQRITSNRNYLIQVLSMNTYDPLIMVVQNILQDIFVNAGLTKVFCGQFLALSSIFGAAMQISCSVLLKSRSASRRKSISAAGAGAGAGAIELKLRTNEQQVDEQQVDEQANGTNRVVNLKSNNNNDDDDSRRDKDDDHDDDEDPYRTRTCKIMLSLQCLAFIVFAHTLILHELYTHEWLLNAQWWLIMVTSLIYLLIRYSADPYYNEQTAELICGTISEPLSSACSITVISLLYNILAIVFVRLRLETGNDDNDLNNIDEDDGTTSISSSTKHQAALYKYSVLLQTGVALFVTLLYLLKFNPIKKKSSGEQQQQQQRQTTADNQAPDQQHVVRLTTSNSSSASATGVTRSSHTISTERQKTTKTSSECSSKL